MVSVLVTRIDNLAFRGVNVPSVDFRDVDVKLETPPSIRCMRSHSHGERTGKSAKGDE
jgi:hypothetical protein